MTTKDEAENLARNIAHEWIRDCDSTTIKMRAAPDVIDPLIDAIASALLAARAEERAEAFEEAAGIAERFAAAGFVTEHGFLLGPNTKRAIASAIRARAKKDAAP